MAKIVRKEAKESKWCQVKFSLVENEIITEAKQSDVSLLVQWLVLTTADLEWRELSYQDQGRVIQSI